MALARPTNVKPLSLLHFSSAPFLGPFPSLSTYPRYIPDRFQPRLPFALFLSPALKPFRPVNHVDARVILLSFPSN